MLNEAPLEELKSQLDEIPELSGLINSAISENASRTITEGGIIKKGYNAQLDKYREALEMGLLGLQNWKQMKSQDRNFHTTN